DKGYGATIAKNIQPLVVQIQAPLDEPVVAPKPKPSIPYPSRANKQRLHEKDDNLASKFVEIFRELHFELSFADALLHWEKCHFMVKEGIVLGHKISKSGIEVDKAKVDVIAKLPHPTSVKGIQSFLGHAGFYRRFI
ncbi:hypothetical protein Tco_0023377, partial [Tanacetum coccineum]